MRQRGMRNREQRQCEGLEAIARKAASNKKEHPHVVSLASMSSNERAQIRKFLAADSDNLRDAW